MILVWGDVMKMKKTGVFSTRNRLMDAMVEIGNQKGFLEISIKEICDLAEVNRSTFYRNYSSKDDLLRDIEATYMQAVDILCNGYHSINISDEASVFENCTKVTRRIYAYHTEAKEVFRFLMNPNCDPYFRDRFKKLLYYHLNKLFCSNIPSPPESIGYAIEYISGGMIDCIYRWIQYEDMSEEDFSDILTQLILQSMQRYFIK